MENGIVMKNYDSIIKAKEPIGYLVNENIKSKIPIYKPIGWFRTLIWWALGFSIITVKD